MKRVSGLLTIVCVAFGFAGACTEMHESDAGAFEEDASVEPAGCADAALSCTGNHSDSGSQVTNHDGGGTAPSTDGGSVPSRPREDAGPSAGQRGDAGPGKGTSDAGVADGAPANAGPRDAGSAANPPSDGGASCRPADCRDQPIPEVACENAPTVVACERGTDGACHVHVRCREGRTCGGLLGEACQAGEFCNMESEVGGDGCLNIADGQGVCTARPSACSDENAPVCGCDFRSYGNACDAHAEGTSVMYEGLCTEIECLALGGIPTYSDGASMPSCRGGDDSFAIHGLEPALCCLPNPRGRADR